MLFMYRNSSKVIMLARRGYKYTISARSTCYTCKEQVLPSYQLPHKPPRTVVHPPSTQNMGAVIRHSLVHETSTHAYHRSF
jgi:hypothetical protein